MMPKRRRSIRGGEVRVCSLRLAGKSLDDAAERPACAGLESPVLRVMSFLAIALIAEMIFFGPLGLTIYDISVRKTLILVLVACSIVPMLMQHRIVTWQIFFLLFTILFVVIWGGIIP